MIICLYKKGIGSNLSRPQIIINLISESYQQNIAETQFGFCRSRSWMLNHCVRGSNRIIWSYSKRLSLLNSNMSKTRGTTGVQIISTHNINHIWYKSRIRCSLWLQTKWYRKSNIFNYYFDFVWKIVSHELDKAFPEGYGTLVKYSELSREQRSQTVSL